MLGSNVGKKVTANLVQDQYNEFLKNKDNKVKKPVLTAEERKMAKREEMRKRGIMVKADDKDEAPTIIEKGDCDLEPCVFVLPENPIIWKKVTKKPSVETQRRGAKSKKKKKSAESDKGNNSEKSDKSKNKVAVPPKPGTPEKRDRKKRKPKPVRMHIDSESNKSKSKTKMTVVSPLAVTPKGVAKGASAVSPAAAAVAAASPAAVKEEPPTSEPHEAPEESNRSSAEKVEAPPIPAPIPVAAPAQAPTPVKVSAPAPPAPAPPPPAPVAAAVQAPAPPPPPVASAPAPALAPAPVAPTAPIVVTPAPPPEPAPLSDPKKETSSTRISEKSSDLSLKVALEPSLTAAQPSAAGTGAPMAVTSQMSATSTRTDAMVAAVPPVDDKQQDAFSTLDDEEFEKVASTQINDKDEKEVLRMAPKILKIAKRHKAMEKCLTSSENETLAQFFSGKHPLTAEVLAVLDVALDKIIDYLQKNNLAVDDETKNIIKHRDKLKAAMMKEFLVSPQYLPKTWTTKFNQWKAEAEKQKYGINWFRVLFAYPKHKSFDDGPEDAFGNFNRASRGLFLGLILGPADVKSFEETKREEDCQGMFLDTRLIEVAVNEPDLTSATKTYVNLDKMDKQSSETKMTMKNNGEKKKEEKPVAK